MKKRSRCLSLIAAFTVAWTIAFAAESAHPQDKPSYAWPIPHSFSQRSAIQIRVVVLEVIKGESKQIDKMFNKHFPDADTSGAVFRLGDDNTDAGNRLVRELVEVKLARVISRPTIMTESGRKATLQVGHRVNVPPTEDPDDEETRDVGLTLQCLPKITEGDRIRLEMEISHATVSADRDVKVKGSEYPVVNEQRMSTTVQTKSGETLAIRKAKGANSLLLLISPVVVPSIPQMSHTPPPLQRPLAPVPARPVVPVAAYTPTVDSTAPRGVMGNLHLIKNAMNSVAPGAAQDISLNGTQFQIQAVFEASEKITEVVNALSKIHSIEIKTVRVYAQGDKTQFEADGVIKSPPLPVRRVSSERYARVVTKSKDSPELTRLQALVSELYPDERIQIRQLNRSVLLRGAVSQRTMPIIVSIAADFFPNVINDLVVTEKPKQKPQIRQAVPGKPGSLNDDVRRLRDDVNSLRADVQKIIELLQRPPANKAALIGPPRTGSVAVNQSKASKSTDWNLTLPEAIAIAKQNAQSDRWGRRNGEQVLAESVSKKFAELRQLRLQWIAAKSRTTWPLDMASSVSSVRLGNNGCPAAYRLVDLVSRDA